MVSNRFQILFLQSEVYLIHSHLKDMKNCKIVVAILENEFLIYWPYKYVCNELGVCEGLGGQYHTNEQNTIRDDIILFNQFPLAGCQ